MKLENLPHRTKGEQKKLFKIEARIKLRTRTEAGQKKADKKAPRFDRETMTWFPPSPKWKYR